MLFQVNSQNCDDRIAAFQLAGRMKVPHTGARISWDHFNNITCGTRILAIICVPDEHPVANIERYAIVAYNDVALGVVGNNPLRLGVGQLVSLLFWLRFDHLVFKPGRVRTRARVDRGEKSRHRRWTRRGVRGRTP